MNYLSTKQTVIILAAISLLFPSMVYADGIVTAGTTQLGDSATSSAPAQWWLDQNFTSTIDPFLIGIDQYGYNQLTIDGQYSFTALTDLKIGAPNAYGNQLNIQQGGQVAVNGNVYNGNASISYYSHYNQINISGIGSALSVTGNLDMSNGYNATENLINLSDNGIAIVDGTFSLYNHWAYGNSWMELDGGALLLAGDKTADFTAGNGILSSIKVWDDLSADFQRIAYYSGQTLIETSYFDMFAVDYIQDAAMAAALGFSNDFIGYTAVRNATAPVPEPATILLFGAGLFGLAGARRKKNATAQKKS